MAGSSLTAQLKILTGCEESSLNELAATRAEPNGLFLHTSILSLSSNALAS
jgi:hypothetical protein